MSNFLQNRVLKKIHTPSIWWWNLWNNDLFGTSLWPASTIGIWRHNLWNPRPMTNMTLIYCHWLWWTLMKRPEPVATRQEGNEWQGPFIRLWHAPNRMWMSELYETGGLTRLTLTSTLELGCLNGKFFASYDRFSSLAFDRMIPRVFDFSFVITFTNCTVVPWEPFPLWVVPLVHVNGLHQWPVRRWFSSMFDCDTFIHMLKFILWLGRDGVQDPESCMIWLRLQGVICYSWLYTCFFYTDGCDHTVWLYIYDNDTSILNGCVHTLDIRFTDVRSYLDGCAHAMDPFI